MIKLLKPLIEAIRRFWRKKHLTQILLLSGLTFVLLTILFFAFTASQANVQSLQEGLTQTTVIYDKDGDVATRVDTNRTEGIDVKELPEYIPNAVIAIEDRRFKAQWLRFKRNDKSVF
jgi:penicillin-binding protein 2A